MNTDVLLVKSESFKDSLELAGRGGSIAMRRVPNLQNLYVHIYNIICDVYVYAPEGPQG